MKRALYARLALAASLSAGFLTALGRAHAQGQPWLSDRRFGSGIGIRVGDLELHPGVAGEIGYDSNYFQGSGEVTPPGQAVSIAPEYQPVTAAGAPFGATGRFNEPTIGSLRFRLTPSLTLKTLGAQRSGQDGGGASASPKLNLQADLSASYNELIGLDGEYADDVSGQRYLSADLGVVADILPGQEWGLGLNGAYNRSVQPVNDPTAPPAFDRSSFRLGAGLKWRPGGGLIDWSLGYQLTYVLFENSLFSNFSSIYHGFTLNGRWRFLPRTAAIYRGEIGFLVYPSSNGVTNDGEPISSQLGLNGLITSHFAATVIAGYKVLFFDQGDEFDSVVGNAELTWYPLPRPDLDPKAASVGLSSISLGYRRDGTQAYLGNYAVSDLIYAKGSYFVGGNVLLTLDAGFDHLTRPESFFSNDTRQSVGFSDNRFNVTAFGEYRTSDSLAVNATLRYSAALTARPVPVSSDVREVPLAYDDLGFDRIELWLGVRWFL
jgi:hypothetical protein